MTAIRRYVQLASLRKGARKRPQHAESAVYKHGHVQGAVTFATQEQSLTVDPGEHRDGEDVGKGNRADQQLVEVDIPELMGCERIDDGRASAIHGEGENVGVIPRGFRSEWAALSAKSDGVQLPGMWVPAGESAPPVEENTVRGVIPRVAHGGDSEVSLPPRQVVEDA